ncbi:ABC-type polysaccharide/polyol phosphate export permease [Nakamurella sp. UYEF19]|uniref:ABC transporter permease n=1 Tax=Nakamurella sp. UYEF19 TaxID=1756392 RepID=UPI00339492AC
MLGLVAIALLFSCAVSWVFALVRIAVRDSETAQLAGFVVIFPLTFASSAFVALATVPARLQAFVRNQPVSFAVDASRELALGTDSGGTVWKLLAWSCGLITVFVPLALRQYNHRTS